MKQELRSVYQILTTAAPLISSRLSLLIDVPDFD